jgi:hypothetical protein
MGDVVTNSSNADLEVLFFDAPDAALEAAAAPLDKAGAMTLAFCSGLDVCSPGDPLFHGAANPHL